MCTNRRYEHIGTTWFGAWHDVWVISGVLDWFPKPMSFVTVAVRYIRSFNDSTGMLLGWDTKASA